MSATPSLPLVIEPEALQAIQHNPDILIIDLSTEKQFRQTHIEGAVFVNYDYIVGVKKPVFGLLPDPLQFSQLINTLGITQDTHIIAYDEEGGGKAARLIWTLHAMGHTKASLLNGGFIAWYKENFPYSNQATANRKPNPVDRLTPVDFTMQPVVADTDYIKNQLDNPSVGLLDARSLDEYTGKKKYSQKVGHIPGAIHFEWTRGMDAENNYRLLSEEKLQPILNELGLTKDKEIIVYCQSHHRSSLSYLMLKYLGYEKVRGYPGAWSEWGNRSDTPVEI